MSDLDHAAIEAAMDGYFEEGWRDSAYTDVEQERVDMTAAIRAYQTAMAPQVREAVDDLMISVEKRTAIEDWDVDSLAEAQEVVDRKERTLLALVGASEETE